MLPNCSPALPGARPASPSVPRGLLTSHAALGCRGGACGACQGALWSWPEPDLTQNYAAGDFGISGRSSVRAFLLLLELWDGGDRMGSPHIRLAGCLGLELIEKRIPKFLISDYGIKS